MKLRRKNSVLGVLIFALAAQAVLLSVPTNANLRKIKIGDKMPEFSAIGIDGQVFEYKHAGGKALMVVFLSGGQKQSAQAAEDIKQIVRRFTANAERWRLAVATNDPNAGAYFQMKKKKSTVDFHLLLDTEYKLWGKFGIIATPTAIISDMNDTAICIKAGHGYDFAPVIEARLNQALGIPMYEGTDPNDASRVRTVMNATVAARIKRHMQMARLLQEKGHLESAIAEMREAGKLDPNSVEVALELGELLCRNGQGKEALKIVGQATATKHLDKARLILISGWAKRQIGELNAAEKLLLEATELNPTSGRGFFELGKVYQAKGLILKAMMSYHKALVQIFGEEPRR